MTGIYMYDETVFDKFRTLVPSGRGELEITDVNNAYIREGTMTYAHLDGWWTDAGTFDSLLRATNLVAETRRRRRTCERDCYDFQRQREIALEMPTCEKGIGKLILAPDSTDLIEGVRIYPFPLWPDDRGYFLEVARIGQGAVRPISRRNHANFGGAELSGNHQGVPLSSPSDRLLGAGAGMLQVALVDLRRIRARMVCAIRCTSARCGVAGDGAAGHCAWL